MMFFQRTNGKENDGKVDATHGKIHQNFETMLQQR